MVCTILSKTKNMLLFVRVEKTATLSTVRAVVFAKLT